MAQEGLVGDSSSGKLLFSITVSDVAGSLEVFAGPASGMSGQGGLVLAGVLLASAGRFAGAVVLRRPGRIQGATATIPTRDMTALLAVPAQGPPRGSLPSASPLSR